MKFLYKEHITRGQRFKEIISPVDSNLTSRININIGNIKDYYDNNDFFIPNNSSLMRFFRKLLSLKEEGATNNSMLSSLATHCNCDSKFRDRAISEVDYPYIYLDNKITSVVKVISIDDKNINNCLSFIYPLKMNLSNTRIIVNPILMAEEIEELGLDYQRYITSVFLIDILEQSFYIALFNGVLKGHLHKRITLSSQPYFLLDTSTYIRKFIRHMYKRLDNRWSYIEVLGRLTISGRTALDIYSINSPIITKNQFNAFVILYESLITRLVNSFNEDANMTYITDLKNILRQTDSNKGWVEDIIEGLKFNPKVNLLG